MTEGEHHVDAEALRIMRAWREVCGPGPCPVLGPCPALASAAAGSGIRCSIG